MSSDPTPAIRAEAISWHIRLREDRADDWDAFTDWLERDPRHSNAYDAIADLARNLGTTNSVEPAIAGRSFTGTIEIDRNESRMFARLAPLLDVDERRGPRDRTLGKGG